ncbi:hypothetical protein KSF_049970 [Reticulibacter mediterranei]|uniref:Uncharacterized protein n=1 Tax=Reticulibacter mediterranei TaxID=2778369 RepID=A0A8J3IGB5_9CHLR|nr:hypothetical protein [Reticulibacter mediterranei]GHO94949.1 hypothetical protein KSF_049970 [Reticulibacter mediterranei]
MPDILNYVVLILFCILAGWLLGRLSSRRQRSLPQDRSRETISARRSVQVRPITYERFPRLRENIRQVQVRRELLNTLTAPSASFVALLRYRAIDLYRSQHDVSWEEAAQAINALYDNAALASGQQGADPLVTALLLQAGCRQDAMIYFCQSTGAISSEAVGAIDFLQNLLNKNDWSFAQGTFELDLASLQFLIHCGYEALAIRYYRERTDVSLTEAYRIVQDMSREVFSQKSR